MTIRKRTPKAKPQTPPDPYPMAIETFRNPGGYWLSEIRQNEPSCFNGIVRVERYRVTVERIEEPREVIAERILKLWRESDNFHHRHPLKAAAARFGVELPFDEFGRDRGRK